MSHAARFRHVTAKMVNSYTYTYAMRPPVMMTVLAGFYLELLFGGEAKGWKTILLRFLPLAETFGGEAQSFGGEASPSR